MAFSETTGKAACLYGAKVLDRLYVKSEGEIFDGKTNNHNL